MKRGRTKRKKYKKVNKVKVLLLFLIVLLVIFKICDNIKAKSSIAETSNNVNKIDKCIVIDAGHGGEEEPGCTFGKLYEKTICLQIAEKLKEKLDSDYTKVIMTRESDVNVYLNERARIANRENADIFVSIHQNALENDTETNGIETWYNPKKDTESKILAQTIQENVVKSSNAKNLGIKESTGLIVITKTEMPACLVETGFLSSIEERNKLIKNDYQERIAEGIYNGIKEYFETDDENLQGDNV